MQEQECGDGTNFVITLAGELLDKAAELIESGVHLADIIIGYERAYDNTLEVLKEIPTYKAEDIKNVE